MLRKLLLTTLFGLVLAITAHAKEVTVCTSTALGIGMIHANSFMSCTGGFNNELTTIVALYKEGWRYVGEISTAGTNNKFILVFEK